MPGHRFVAAGEPRARDRVFSFFGRLAASFHTREESSARFVELPLTHTKTGY